MKAQPREIQAQELRWRELVRGVDSARDPPDRRKDPRRVGLDPD